MYKPVDEELEENDIRIQFRLDKKYNDLLKSGQRTIAREMMQFHGYKKFGRSEFFDMLMKETIPNGFNIQRLKQFLLTSTYYKIGDIAIESSIRVVDVCQLKNRHYELLTNKISFGVYSGMDSIVFDVEKFPTCMKVIMPFIMMVMKEDYLEEYIDAIEFDYERIIKDFEDNNEVVFKIGLRVIEDYSYLYKGNFTEFDKVLKFMSVFIKDCDNMGKDISKQVNDFLDENMTPERLLLIKEISPKTKFKMLYDMCEDVEYEITPAVEAMKIAL